MDQWELNIATEKSVIMRVGKKSDNMALYTIHNHELPYLKWLQVTRYHNIHSNLLTVYSKELSKHYV